MGLYIRQKLASLGAIFAFDAPSPGGLPGVDAQFDIEKLLAQQQRGKKLLIFELRQSIKALNLLFSVAQLLWGEVLPKRLQIFLMPPFMCQA